MNRNKDHVKIFVLGSNFLNHFFLSTYIDKRQQHSDVEKSYGGGGARERCFSCCGRYFSLLASTTYSQDTWSWKIESKATQAVHSFELKINNCIVHTHILAIASSFHYHALSLLVMWCNCTAARASQTLWISYHHANTDCASFL